MKYRLRLYLTCIAFLLIGIPARSTESPVLINSGVDRTKITIGDRVHYRIRIRKNKNIKLEPFDPMEVLRAFEIKNCETKGPVKRAGKEIQEYIYTITTFFPGNYTIPPLTIRYTDEKGNTLTAWTDTISIFVESVNTDDTYADIKDIKPPLSVKSYLPLYILCTAAGAGIAFYIFWQKKKKKISAEVQEPHRPCHELAMERLKALEQMELVLKGEIKQHYVLLSEIIRRYIEARYSIPAIERTTSELYQEMRVKGIERRHCSMIKELLDQCDLVKFAKFIPAKNEIDSDLARAYEIIELTKEVLKPDDRIQTS